MWRISQGPTGLDPQLLSATSSQTTHRSYPQKSQISSPITCPETVASFCIPTKRFGILTWSHLIAPRSQQHEAPKVRTSTRNIRNQFDWLLLCNNIQDLQLSKKNMYLYYIYMLRSKYIIIIIIIINNNILCRNHS
jgi:hypothetical protein